MGVRAAHVYCFSLLILIFAEKGGAQTQSCSVLADCAYTGCNDNGYGYGCNCISRNWEGHFLLTASNFVGTCNICHKTLWPPFTPDPTHTICPKKPTNCPAGQYVVGDTCQPCTNNSYCLGGTLTTPSPCTIPCGPSFYETTACTASTNRVCTACPVGSFCLGNTHIANCTTTCSAGTYETGGACTSSTNKICTNCTVGSFCLGDTHIANCTHCQAGTIETSACSSTADSICVS